MYYLLKNGVAISNSREMYPLVIHLSSLIDSGFTAAQVMIVKRVI